MYCDDFKLTTIEDIAIVTVDLLAATKRDAKPLWDELESNGVIQWQKVIIDLSRCTFVDSTFVGMLIRIYKTMSLNNYQMKLVFPESNARFLFHTTAITRIVSCYDTLNEAVDSFNSKFPIRKISFGEEFHKN